MNSEDMPFPSADELHLRAEAMPPKPPLRKYRKTMQSIKDKGYSYQDIADWMSKQLGVPIKRNQVSYMLTTSSLVLDAEEETDDYPKGESSP